jgi:adenosine/AMP kinase
MSLANEELLTVNSVPNLNFAIGITAGKGKSIRAEGNASNAAKGCGKDAISKMSLSKVDAM